MRRAPTWSFLTVARTIFIFRSPFDRFECFGRATNYAAAVKAAGATKVFIATIANELAEAGAMRDQRHDVAMVTLLNFRSNAAVSASLPHVGFWP